MRPVGGMAYHQQQMWHSIAQHSTAQCDSKQHVTAHYTVTADIRHNKSWAQYRAKDSMQHHQNVSLMGAVIP